MANITVRNQPEQQKAAIARPISPNWEPFNLLRGLMGWDPFREIAPLVAQERLEFFPDFDIKETKDQYVFTADLPGVKAGDIEVSASGNRLQVSGKRESEREEKNDTYYACERSYGSFTRSFTLPDGANMDAVKADLKDGVLTLSIGKKAEVQAKKIPVGTTATKS